MANSIELLHSHHCQFQLHSGHACARACDNSEYCHWHQPEGVNNQQQVKQALQQHLKSGASGEGYILKYCDLNNIDLVNRGQHHGINLSYADLYRCNLQAAHLFKVNFQHASLMKADLRDANLHEANLQQCNLLGAKFEGAKIENVHWGKELIQEQQARDQPELALDYYQQIIEICRSIRKVAENQGLFETAGFFFHKEMIHRRLQMPLFSAQRGLSKLVDLFCGYGEKPARVVLFSILFIVFCALGYALGGVNFEQQVIQLQLTNSLKTNLQALVSSLYFSVVTFTTLGYGDITPVAGTRALAAFEAFIGSFTSALFVVVFVKKMTR